MKPFISVIIPIQNEGEKLLDSLLSLDYMLSLSEFSYECLLVYMGVSDESKRVGNRFSKLVKYISETEIRSQDRWGGYIHEGFKKTKGNIRIFLDPGAISIFSEREKIVQKFRDGYECVVGVEHGEREGVYTIPQSIPRMCAIREELISRIEDAQGMFHKRRVLFAEIVGFLIEHNVRVYSIPFKKDESEPLRDTIIDVLAHKKRMISLKRKHKRIQKK